MVTCPADQDRSTQYTGTINDNDDDGDYEDDDGEEEDGETVMLML
jgi:hypothetical protein